MDILHASEKGNTYVTEASAHDCMYELQVNYSTSAGAFLADLKQLGVGLNGRAGLGKSSFTFTYM